jgi:hypothetical protein
MYHEDQAGNDAKRLKLKAFRRMGELAMELRPRKNLPQGASGRVSGMEPGHRALLIEKGLKPAQADAATRLARAPASVFKQLIDRPSPPNPRRAMLDHMRRGSDAWKEFNNSAWGVPTFRAFCRRHQAKSLAVGLASDESKKAREIVTEIQEWLDEFEQYLPK